jgi:hypothetical protein
MYTSLAQTPAGGPAITCSERVKWNHAKSVKGSYSGVGSSYSVPLPHDWSGPAGGCATIKSDRLVARAVRAATPKKHIMMMATRPLKMPASWWQAGGLVPGDIPTITDQMWREAGRAHFRGHAVVGKNLMEIWGGRMDRSFGGRGGLA